MNKILQKLWNELDSWPEWALWSFLGLTVMANIALDLMIWKLIR